jgi:hypothetical protein
MVRCECLQCELETIKHLEHDCKNYVTKIWNLAGGPLTLAILGHLGDYILAIGLIPLDIVFNKFHLSILLHFKDGTTQKEVAARQPDVSIDYGVFSYSKVAWCTILHAFSFEFTVR